MSNPVPTNLWNEGYHVDTDIEIRKSIGHYPSGQQLVTPRFCFLFAQAHWSRLTGRLGPSEV